MVSTQSTGPASANSSTFHLEDRPIDAPRPKIKIAMIGAGFSGIIAGIRIDQRLKDFDLTIYEKNPSVGGTWYENKYPGLACDIPAHSYSLTFAPNPKWSRFYAPGPEILSYLQDVTARYKLERYLKYCHKLTSATWDESASQWDLTFDLLNEKGEKIGELKETADVVIQGMGGLSRWDWPDIKGLKEFKGELLHSAAYEGVAEDQKGKRVAVIGSGSSAIQIVPALQPLATQVDNYVRGKTWISTGFAATELTKRQPDGRNHQFSEEEKERFAKDPDYYRSFRHSMESELNSTHEATIKNSAMQNGAVEAFTALMKQRLSKKPEIAKVLIPGFPVACRRLTPGPGYLEALVEDNVDFISTEIKRITPTGIETLDGVHREYDTIVCATGFDTSFRPRIPIIGRNGTSLQDMWDDLPTSYMSISTENMPNWWIMNGPNSSVGSGSLLVLFEYEAEYIIQAIAKMQREDLKSICVKPESVKNFMDYVGAYFTTTVYSEKCRSWYKKGLEIGPVVALWPGSCLHALRALEHPRWEDFDYVRRGQKNQLAWLGNGWTQVEKDMHPDGDRAFYLNDMDVPPVPL